MTEKRETHLIKPQDLKKRAERVVRTQRMVDHSEKENDEIIVKEKKDDEKFVNTAGRVKINFETLGRFDIPKTLHFDDYSGKHVIDISLSNEDNLVENLLTIMQDLMLEKDQYNVGDMLPQEFIEAMVGIKIKFNTPIHEHKWICDCQIKDENRVPHTETIDLRELVYVSILEADENLKKFLKAYFEDMSDLNFQKYLETKYGEEEEVINHQDYDRKEELNKIQISEPISQNIGEDVLKFRFARMKDIVTAQKLVENKYAVEIKKIEMKKPHGIKKAELELKKEKEMGILHTNKMKDLVYTAKALTLVSCNDEIITDDKKKLEVYEKVGRKELLEFNEVLEYMGFGIREKREFKCPLCEKSDGRLLHREFDPYEFIPLDVSPDNTLRQHTRGSILFGV